jgi:glutathione peroxidase
MNRKRIALAAFAVAAAAGIALLAAALVLKGIAARSLVVDAIGPIANISESGPDETSGDALVPNDNGAGFLPVPPPLDDDRVVDAVGPLVTLASHRDDPPYSGGADAPDALDAPLASWSDEEQQAGVAPLLAAAMAPIASLPASSSERVAESAQARADVPADCPALLRQEFRRLQTGESQSLCQFRGKVLLVVNTASYCGYTGQYEGLEALYRKYKGRGLVVVGFPSNDFGGQEPGTNAEIAQFCRLTYGVQFPMFEKSSVTKLASNPLFAALAASTGVAPQWNFYKYVVDRHGNAIAGFDSRTTPDDRTLVALIERLLADRSSIG